jgi:tetratricopeptide (TPR) repeat protein
VSELEAQLREALADRYRVLRPLGSGGMAEVFLAEEIRHGRQVAIKVLKPDLAAKLGAERFQQEIAFAARLNHPNILPLLDSGAAAGTLYYTMPYASGESVRERLTRERQFPVVESLHLGEQVARALDYAHRQGVIHRDIKPENVLLVDGQAMVADFGIARAVRSAGGARITDSGTTLGTPLYMSPEQATGDREVDGRSDIYSLACVVHELLAGQPPFTGTTAEAIVMQHLSVAPRPVSELRPTTPPAATAAILKALAKSPADRYSKASEFADALAGAAAVASTTAAHAVATPDAPPSGTPVGRVSTTARTVASMPAATTAPRRGLAIGATVAILLAVAAFVGWRAGWFGGASHKSAAGRQWVLFAEMEGPPDDPSVAPAARDLIAAALDQSTTVATVPREQVRLALRLAGKPDTTRVTDELARELAFRSSIRVVIEGAIHKLGGGYSTVLRAVNSEDGRAILTATDTARDPSDLVASIGRVSAQLRRGLGENSDAVQATRALPMVATPSFEAYQRYDRARRLLNNSDDEGSILLYKEAIALDPEFAAAWAGLATARLNQFQLDSARAAAHRALEIPGRLTDFSRIDLQAKVARMNGDLLGAIQLHDQALALDLTPIERAITLNNKGTNLDILNRSEEALAQYRASAEIWPIQAPQVAVGNIANMLIALGRTQEARAELARMTPTAQPFFDMMISMEENRGTRAESLAVAVAGNPATNPLVRMPAYLTMWAYVTRRGEIERSRAQSEELNEMAVATSVPLAVSTAWSVEAWSNVLTGRPLPAIPAASKPNTLDPVGRTVAYAMAGDTAALTRTYAGVRPNIPNAYRDDVWDLLRGVAAVRSGRNEAGMTLLAGQTRRGYANGHPMYETLRMMSRWFAADVYERDHPDSAVTYLSLMENPPDPNFSVRILGVGSWPFLQRRLALLEARLGHNDEAQKHWLAFSESFTHPDADLQPWVDETRATLFAAGAMGTPPRK